MELGQACGSVRSLQNEHLHAESLDLWLLVGTQARGLHLMGTVGRLDSATTGERLRSKPTCPTLETTTGCSRHRQSRSCCCAGLLLRPCGSTRSAWHSIRSDSSP